MRGIHPWLVAAVLALLAVLTVAFVATVVASPPPGEALEWHGGA